MKKHFSSEFKGMFDDDKNDINVNLWDLDGSSFFLDRNINYNDNRLKRGRQINQEYSYEENENIIRYRDESYNMNLSQQKNKSKSGYGSIEQKKHRIVKQGEEYDQEQDQGYERDDWNKSNNIQQTNKIFISPQHEGRDQMGIMGYSEYKSEIGNIKSHSNNGRILYSDYKSEIGKS